MVPKIYFVRVVMDPAAVDGLSAWYKTRHASDLIDVGFLSVHHHHVADGDGQVTNVYEIEDVAVFDGEYESSQQRDPHLTGTIMKAANNGSTQTVYRQEAFLPPLPEHSLSSEGASLASSFPTPVIGADMFDTTVTVDDVIGAFESIGPALELLPGWVRSRLVLKDDRQHPRPNNVYDDRPWLILTEWSSLSAAQTAGKSAVVNELALALGTPIEAQSELSVKLMGLLHTDKWAP
jgi:hypothetical protein